MGITMTDKKLIGTDTETVETARQYTDHVEYTKNVKIFNVYEDGTRELAVVTTENNSSRNVILEQAMQEAEKGGAT